MPTGKTDRIRAAERHAIALVNVVGIATISETREFSDPIDFQQWHVHDCTFQFVYVLNGWATFEYEGQGQRTIRKGDSILQVPGIKHREIACSDDFEVLEIVAPANFATRIVEAPKAEAAE